MIGNEPNVAGFDHVTTSRYSRERPLMAIDQAPRRVPQGDSIHGDLAVGHLDEVASNGYDPLPDGPTTSRAATPTEVAPLEPELCHFLGKAREYDCTEPKRAGRVPIHKVGKAVAQAETQPVNARSRERRDRNRDGDYKRSASREACPRSCHRPNLIENTSNGRAVSNSASQRDSDCASASQGKQWNIREMPRS
jgi:hypothetical protein